MRASNYSLYKCFLLLTPVITNNPDIHNTCIAIRAMAMSPLFYIEWRTLKFNCPALAIGMCDKYIRDAVRLWQALLKGNHSQGKL